MNKYDVVIIGAGSGGYPCAIRLGQSKKKVLVVESKQLGGLCLNWGCIPTKALLFAAEMLDNFEKAKKLGIMIEQRGLDIHALAAWKDGVVNRLRKGIEFLFKANNVTWQQGRAKILSEHQVEIKKNDSREICETEDIVIATGTEVMPLPGLDFDGSSIIDTDDALEIREIPKRLLVIGAGASGLEMASIYRRLGSMVVVVEIMGQILPGMEGELCMALHKILKKSGIDILLNSQVLYAKPKEHELEVTIRTTSGDVKENFDKILVTVGRRPTDYSFREMGIGVDSRGYVLVDNKLRTSVRNIYAIGDVTGPPLLAHKATRQGSLCAEIISGLLEKTKPQAIPSCVFTIPTLASVGLTEKEARDQGHDVRIGRFPYRALGKALAMEEHEGLVKIVGDENGRLLGLHILGAEASSLIGEGTLALEKGISIRDLTEVIHPHPTLTEAILEAAENFYNKAIHIVNKSES